MGLSFQVACTASPKDTDRNHFAFISILRAQLLPLSICKAALGWLVGTRSGLHNPRFPCRNCVRRPHPSRPLQSVIPPNTSDGTSGFCVPAGKWLIVTGAMFIRHRLPSDSVIRIRLSHWSCLWKRGTKAGG